MFSKKSDLECFTKALKKGNVDRARDMLDAHSEYLDLIFEWDNGNSNGSALHLAAFFDRPEMIDFLVKEKEVDINRQKNIGGAWTPLHHACIRGSTDAAIALLSFGADPFRETDDGRTIFAPDFSKKVKKALDPFRHRFETWKISKKIEEETRRLEQEKEQQAEKTLLEEKRQREKDAKVSGIWTLSGPKEVICDRELPNGAYALTDVFNFETRKWTALAKNNENGNVAQNILFFDDVSDTTALEQALDKLNALGGTAEPCSIERRRLRKPAVL